MMTPVQVTFRDIPHSEALEAHVLKRAAKLETFSDRITGCHVALEAPHRHQHTGRHFHVRIDLTVPGGEVVVSRPHEEDPTNEDPYAAIDRAFDRLVRQLVARRSRAENSPRRVEE